MSVFSSDLVDMSGFLIPRTVDATAVTFSEPDEAVPRTSINRQHNMDNQSRRSTCNRPIIHLGTKIGRFQNKTSAVIDNIKKKPILRKISEIVEDTQKKIERFQMRANGRTSFEDCLGLRYQGAILHFGETVVLRRPMGNARTRSQ